MKFIPMLAWIYIFLLNFLRLDTAKDAIDYWWYGLSVAMSVFFIFSEIYYLENIWKKPSKCC